MKILNINVSFIMVAGDEVPVMVQYIRQTNAREAKSFKQFSQGNNPNSFNAFLFERVLIIHIPYGITSNL